MKTIASLLLLLAASALPIYAQDAQAAKGGKALMESQTVTRPKEEKKLPVTPPKPTKEILGKHVVYGGYFMDFVRAEKKRPFFSLRTPIDPQKDMENLSFYPGTDKVQGVVFFSIKF